MTPGQTGVFDFSASNAFNFGFMVSRLTDAKDELLFLEQGFYNAAGVLFGGNGMGNPESVILGGPAIRCHLSPTPLFLNRLRSCSSVPVLLESAS